MKKTTAYETEDGRQFATKEEALAHESGVAMVAYLSRVLPVNMTMTDDGVVAIVDAIRADTDGLAEAIKPLLPKRTRADKGQPRPGQRGRPRAAPRAA